METHTKLVNCQSYHKTPFEKYQILVRKSSKQSICTSQTESNFIDHPTLQTA